MSTPTGTSPHAQQQTHLVITSTTLRRTLVLSYTPGLTCAVVISLRAAVRGRPWHSMPALVFGGAEKRAAYVCEEHGADGFYDRTLECDGTSFQLEPDEVPKVRAWLAKVYGPAAEGTA